MLISSNLRSPSVFLAALVLSTAAQAQIFRAYLASDGSDANPCTLPLPCRLLPAAHAAVASGGEIWMLDSANYNTAQFNITKSVTVLAVPGAVGSVVATGLGSAISIDAAGVKVALRNLVIVHLGGSDHGIHFAQGAELDVTQCDVANVASYAIYATAAGGKVSITDTVLRGAAIGFFADGTVIASLDRVRATGNYVGVVAGTGSRVTVGNSVMSGNSSGAYAESIFGAARLVIERSTVTGNAIGILARTLAQGDVVEVIASRSIVSHNAETGFYAEQVAASSVTVVSDGNVVSNNGYGFRVYGGTPTLYTRGNNTMLFNGADTLGGTLTTLAPK